MGRSELLKTMTIEGYNLLQISARLYEARTQSLASIVSSPVPSVVLLVPVHPPGSLGCVLREGGGGGGRREGGRGREGGREEGRGKERDS